MIEAESDDDKQDAELQSMTDAERPSKSQLKREANDILELASRLGETSESSLTALPLAENIRDAVLQLKKITANSARKRQLHFLAKLLRKNSDDVVAIEEALALQQVSSLTATRLQHECEQWRDRLLDPSAEHSAEALTQFASEYPGADLQTLRQKMRSCHKEMKKAEQQTNASKAVHQKRELFKWLRNTISDS